MRGHPPLPTCPHAALGSKAALRRNQLRWFRHPHHWARSLGLCSCPLTRQDAEGLDTTLLRTPESSLSAQRDAKGTDRTPCGMDQQGLSARRWTLRTSYAPQALTEATRCFLREAALLPSSGPSGAAWETRQMLTLTGMLPGSQATTRNQRSWFLRKAALLPSTDDLHKGLTRA